MAYGTQSSDTDEFELDEFGMFKFGFVIAGAGFNVGGSGGWTVSTICGRTVPSLLVNLMPEYLMRGCEVFLFFNKDTALLIETLLAFGFLAFSIFAIEMHLVAAGFGWSSIGFGVGLTFFVIALSKL